MKNTVTAFTVTLILVATFTLAFDIQSVQASRTIYIRADGSIDPPTANITSTDNVTYTFMDNNYDSIVVERSSIIVDGAGYTLQGAAWVGNGFYWSGINNVTIKHTNIINFNYGIRFEVSSNNTISGNSIANNRGAAFLFNSSYCTLCANNITDNSGDHTVYLLHSSNNTIEENTIANNGANPVIYILDGSSYNHILNNVLDVYPSPKGIFLHYGSKYNVIAQNTITNASNQAIWIESYSSDTRIYGNTIKDNVKGVEIFSSNNVIFHNNFISNTQQVSLSSDCINVWDDGYSSGGNYWSSYAGVDVKSGPSQNLPGSDGIGDAQLVLDASNADNYPLMHPYLGPVRNLHTGESYPAIQPAIDDAADGDTILALSGVYREHLLVNKSISLYGQGENTVVDGGGEWLPIIHVFFTANVTISDLVVQNTTASLECYGISLYRVSDCTIQNVVVRSSYYGVRIDNSTNCRLLDSKIVNNSNSGIVLFSQSTHNQIVGNWIIANPTGILVDGSTNNLFCHNNLVNNTRQTVVFAGPNAWDNGYPSGGNYWSNYTDADIYKGPGQNETGSDGVWDHPYIIDADNQDRYPLTRPFGGPAGDVDGDRDVDIFDIVRMAGVYGVKYPDPRYDRLCDMDLDGDVDIFDIVKAAGHYGDSW